MKNNQVKELKFHQLIQRLNRTKKKQWATPSTKEFSCKSEDAIFLAQNMVLDLLSDMQIVDFQLFCQNLCIDFRTFHRSIENVLGRSVWTHEFVYPENLIKEYLLLTKRPSMEEIIGLIPKDKLIKVNVVIS